MTDGKKQVSAIAREGSWEAFKQAVLSKHGKLHTVLGEELSDAMDAYASNHLSHASQHAHTSLPLGHTNFHRKLALVYSKVPKEFQDLKTLDAIIERYAGGDDRTIRRYRKALTNWNLVVRIVEDGPGHFPKTSYSRGACPQWLQDLVKEGSP